MILSIFGSCISRDCIEYTKNIDLKYYYARSSFISAFSKNKIKIDTKQITSNFQRLCVDRDVNKTFIVECENFGNILLIDFIDERYGVCKIRDTYYTPSYELLSTKFYEYDEKIIFGSPKYHTLFNNAFGFFIEKMFKLNLLDNIYINKAYFAEYDNAGVYFAG